MVTHEKDTDQVPEVDSRPTPQAEPDPGAATDEFTTLTEVGDPGDTLTYPQWGPQPVDGGVSLHHLQLAHYSGLTTTVPNIVAQPHLERLEDFLRSHAVGGTNRVSEGYYGPKTRELVNAAHVKYLGVDGDGSPTEQLLNALRAAGLQVDL